MPKDEWGVKRICPTTGRRFYDLGKTPIVSPYTGETVILDANTRTRVAAPEKKAEKAEDTDTDDGEILVDDAADDSKDSAVDDDLLDDNDDVSLDEITDVAAKDDDD